MAQTSKYLKSFLWASFFWLPLLLLILLNCTDGSPDYKAHMDFASGKSLQELLHLGLPHLLVHFSLNKISGVLNTSLEMMFFYYTGLSVLLLVFVKVLLIDEVAPALTARATGLLAGASCFLGAIYIENLNPYHYLGIWSPLVYHNPTTVWLKPFALITIFLILKYRITEPKVSNKKAEYLISAFLAVATLIKPNFTIAILPVFFIIFLLDRDFWKMVRLSIFSVVILLAQFYITFAAQTEQGNKMIFSLAGPWRVYSHNIIGAILQNLAAPLVITYALYKVKKINSGVLFLWVLTLVSLLQGVFMAEQGHRFEGMNFIWGYVVAVEILFLYLIVQLMKNRDLLSKPAKYFNYFLVLWHFCSGSYFVFGCIIGKGPFSF